MAGTICHLPSHCQVASQACISIQHLSHHYISAAVANLSRMSENRIFKNEFSSSVKTYCILKIPEEAWKKLKGNEIHHFWKQNNFLHLNTRVPTLLKKEKKKKCCKIHCQCRPENIFNYNATTCQRNETREQVFLMKYRT